MIKVFALCIVASGVSLSAAVLSEGKLFAVLVLAAFVLLGAAVICAGYIK